MYTAYATVASQRPAVLNPIQLVPSRPTSSESLFPAKSILKRLEEETAPSNVQTSMQKLQEAQEIKNMIPLKENNNLPLADLKEME